MKITDESIRSIYVFAKDVYLKKISKKEAVDYCVEKEMMAKASATDYIQNLKYLMTGFVYKRTMNLYATEYFLREIKSDFGFEAFKLALHTVKEHTIYYNLLGYGKQIKIQDLVEKLEKEHSIKDSFVVYPDEEIAVTFSEGAQTQRFVNAYERNPQARKCCIEHYGYNCSVCGFNFEDKFGSLGAGFIHIHHVRDLAEIASSYQVDPVKDLRPVCPNCHAMLHKAKPALSIEKLKEYLLRS